MSIRFVAFIIVMVFCFTVNGLSAAPEFTENKGQWDSYVHFRADLPGGVLWMEDDALTFLLMGQAYAELGHNLNIEYNDEDYRLHSYQMRFLGSSTVSTEGRKPLDHLKNYYIGQDMTRWAKGVRSFRQTKYNELYPGIDLLVYSKGDHLKYDYTVKPGADPAQIQVEYAGADGVFLQDGSLYITTSVRDVVELEPFAYQLIDGSMQEVPCAFNLEGDVVSYTLGEYDPNYTLIIDPEISFASYIGAIASNFGFTATDDPDGNLIAGACVFAAGYPTTLGAIQDDFEIVYNGYCDVAVSKFSADGSQLLYSTYLGGEGVEMPHSVIANEEGDYFVMGTTGSTNFPTTPGAFQPNLIGGPFVGLGTFFVNANHNSGVDFFVSKFAADDVGLLASTYVGGNDTDGLNLADKLFYNYGDAFRGEIIVDQNGNVVIASTTYSTDFPEASPTPLPDYHGGQDGIVFRLNSTLTNFVWSAYIGGSDDDAAYSVQEDSNMGLVVTGGTKSSNMAQWGTPEDDTYNGDIDSFVMRFSPNGLNVEASTYLGTDGYEQSYFVQLDLQDNIYLVGQNEGTLEATPGVYSNPNSGQFIVKYNYELSNIEWLTTIGTGSGEIDISLSAFLVSDCDQIYLSGWGGLTNTLNSQYANSSTTIGLPLTPDAYQTDTDGSDFYLAVLNPDATDLNYATFFGGGESREHVDGGTSKFDKDGSVYQAVCAGCGGNDDFPTTPGAWSADNASVNCNLGVFKFDLGQIEAAIEIDGPAQVCEGAPANFINNTSGGDTYQWFFGDDESSNAFEPQHVYETSGTFEVMLAVSASGECLPSDTAYLQIEVLPGVNPLIDEAEPICEGGSVQLNAFGSDQLFWLDDPTLSATDIPNPIASPTEPTTYFAVDMNDCETDTVSVFVDFVVINTSVSDDATICIGESVELEATGGELYTWSPITGISNPVDDSPLASPEETTTYTVSIVTPEGCETEEEVTITVDTELPGGLVYDPVQVCTGYSIQLAADDGIAWSWEPADLCNNPFLQNPTVTVTEETLFTVEVTNACGSGEDQVLVEVIIPTAEAGVDGQVCFGEWYPVHASGGLEYQWLPASLVLNPNSDSTFVKPPDDQVFTVYVTDEFGCVASAEVNVDVLPLPYVNAGPDRVLAWLESDYLFGTSDPDEYWWEPEIYLDCTDCTTPVVTPDESTWYVFHAIDENGCIGRDSVYVDVFNPIYVPNSFSPNNDGINDVFLPQGINIREFRMEIYNRWGELIFVTDDPEKGWNGSVRDGEHYVQIDTYVWVIFHDTKEGMERLTGHVTVVR